MKVGVPIFLRNGLGRYGGSIAAKLYFFATLSIVAVVALAGSAIYFTRVTEVAAVRLYDQGFLGTQNSARLGLLLEQHRRIVESMPSEVDRQRIDKALRELDDTQAKLEELMRQLVGQRNLPPGALERRIATSLPYLFEAGQRVIFYAREFAFIDQPLGRYRIHGPSLREGGVEHPSPGYLATRAELYRQLCGEVARAGADVGCDVAAITRKFQAIARESELQCHARSGRRLQALQLVWEHDDPEFDRRLATRLFRRASLTLDVLMPNASYSAWRTWYRGSRLFRLMHRAQPIRD